MIHPTADTLLSYFSAIPEKLLSAQQHKAVTEHVERCLECAAFSREIREHDAIWASISPIPETEDEEKALIKGLHFIRSLLSGENSIPRRT